MEFKDFYEAYWWLYNHPIFQYEIDSNIDFLGGEPLMSSFFDRAIDIEVVKVNPKDNTINDDDTLNTKTEIWIEVSIEYNHKYDCADGHAWYLDTGGDTFEEAIINLTNLVYKYYKNGKELLVDPLDERL